MNSSRDEKYGGDAGRLAGTKPVLIACSVGMLPRRQVQTFAADKATASWLPDEASARGWARITERGATPR